MLTRPRSKIGQAIPGGIEFNGAKFTPLSVNKNEPSWLVTATGAAAIGLIGNVPQDFIRIRNLTPGASVTADFDACIRDIETTIASRRGRTKARRSKRLRSA